MLQHSIVIVTATGSIIQPAWVQAFYLEEIMQVKSATHLPIAPLLYPEKYWGALTEINLPKRLI